MSPQQARCLSVLCVTAGIVCFGGGCVIAMRIPYDAFGQIALTIVGGLFWALGAYFYTLEN